METWGSTSKRYVLISTDCHAGADLRDYKPYLDTRWPVSGLPENDIRQLVAGNAAELNAADLDYLRGLADRVGPTVTEIATPLRKDEIPADPIFAHLGRPGARRTHLVGSGTWYRRSSPRNRIRGGRTGT